MQHFMEQTCYSTALCFVHFCKLVSTMTLPLKFKRVSIEHNVQLTTLRLNVVPTSESNVSKCHGHRDVYPFKIR